MPITPTSTKSKQYQALGIDEIANDIETAFEAINELEAGGGSDYTETIVNISSAQILAMGTTPIELLPSPGAGKYYDYYGFVEFDYGTAAYVLPDMIGIGDSVDYSATFFSSQIITSTENVAKKFLMGSPSEDSASPGALQSYPVRMNRPVEMFTYNATDPITGDGTLRVKIYHKTVTFGA